MSTLTSWDALRETWILTKLFTVTLQSRKTEFTRFVTSVSVLLLECKLRPFVKDLEALVKWASEFQNPLVHKPIYSSTTFILFIKHL